MTSTPARPTAQPSQPPSTYVPDSPFLRQTSASCCLLVPTLVLIYTLDCLTTVFACF
ncbi:hypothetical protein BJX96DRAFT_146033 [Aspergillus floccosus]